MIAHLEDLLDLVKFVSAFTNIVLQVQRVIDAWSLRGHEASDVWSTSVEVARFSIVAWLSTHDGSTMVNLTIVMQKVKKHVAKIDVLRYFHLVQLPVLYKSHNHEQQSIAAESSMVWVI